MKKEHEQTKKNASAGNALSFIRAPSRLFPQSLPAGRCIVTFLQWMPQGFGKVVKNHVLSKRAPSFHRLRNPKTVKSSLRKKLQQLHQSVNHSCTPRSESGSEAVNCQQSVALVVAWQAKPLKQWSCHLPVPSVGKAIHGSCPFTASWIKPVPQNIPWNSYENTPSCKQQTNKQTCCRKDVCKGKMQNPSGPSTNRIHAKPIKSNFLHALSFPICSFTPPQVYLLE